MKRRKRKLTWTKQQYQEIIDERKRHPRRFRLTERSLNTHNKDTL